MLFYKLAQASQDEVPAAAQRQQQLARQQQMAAQVQPAPVQQGPPPVQQGPPPPMTPSQQIMAKLQQDQIYQYNLKMQDLAQKAQTGTPPTFAQMIQQSREQQGMQDMMTKKQYMMQQAMAELQNIMPKQTVQDMEQTTPMDPNRKMQLEQIYATLGQAPGQPPIISQTSEQVLNQSYTRPFQGQFIDVNADAMTRVLKERTTSVPAM